MTYSGNILDQFRDSGLDELFLGLSDLTQRVDLNDTLRLFTQACIRTRHHTKLQDEHTPSSTLEEKYATSSPSSLVRRAAP